MVRKRKQEKQGTPTSPQRKDYLEAASTWLADNRLAVLIAVVALSVLFRVIYFVQLNSTPLVQAHRWDQSDMNNFHNWAQDIVAGDWLTQRITAPMHDWQIDIADTWLKSHPEQAALLIRENSSLGLSTENPAKLLYAHWAGELKFYQEPLYAYLVAVTYKLFGADPRWVFAWQMILGILTNVFIFILARRYFGDLVGTTAGLMAAFCSPLMFYEMILLRETLIVFTGFALILLADEARDRATIPWWVGAGLAFGIAFNIKNTFILLEAGLTILIVWRYLAERQKLAPFLISVVIGFILALIPLVARNVVVGVPPVTTAANGPITFLNANTEDYPALLGGFHVSRKYAPYIMGETEGKFLPVVRKTVATHPGVGSLIAMSWHKLSTAWQWMEIPNNESFYFYRLNAPVLWLPVTFWMLSPLALVGIWMARRSQPALPLYVLAATCFLPLIIFYVVSRLRLPLEAAAIPFAAFALVEIFRSLLQGKWGKLFALLVAVIVLGLWTSRDLTRGLSLIRPIDYMLPYIVSYREQEAEALKRNDSRKAVEVLRAVLRFEPEDGTSVHPSLIRFYASIHHNLSLALKASGDEAASREEKRIAVRLTNLITPGNR